MSFVKESNVYEKIKGLGLAPELSGIWDGAIEHEFIEGRNFDEALRETFSNPYDFIKYVKLFLDWYKRFRDAAKISLGDMDFSDFIITPQTQLYCIDFEHCKPASPEQDIANLVAVIALDGGGYNRLTLEDAKIFVKTAFDEIELSSEKLYYAIKQALCDKCSELGIKSLSSANEYLASFVCSSFAHKPDYGHELEKIMEAISISKHMWTIFAEDVNLETEKEIRCLMSNDKENYDVFFITKNGKVQDFPLMIRTEGTYKVLQQIKDPYADLKDLLKMNFRCKGFAIEEM